MCNTDRSRALEQRHACILQALQVWSELDMMFIYAQDEVSTAYDKRVSGEV